MPPGALFQTTPYGELTVAAIARETGLAKGTVFLYFRSRPPAPYQPTPKWRRVLDRERQRRVIKRDVGPACELCAKHGSGHQYATSMEDLVEATDVQRYGLYSSFESKHGIFLAVLDHYHETVITRNLSGLEVNGAGLAEVRAFFDWLLRIVLAPGPSKGCLLCNTGIEVAPVDAEAATRVDRYMHIMFFT